MKLHLILLLIGLLGAGQDCRAQRQAEEKTFALSDSTVEKGAIYRTWDLEFDHDVIAIASEPVLDSLAQLMTQQPGVLINISVHVEKGYQKNYEIDQQKLDQARADSMKQYLINHGISSMRIVAVGKGMYAPLVREADLEGLDPVERHTELMKNRRVEFTIIGKIQKK